MGCDSRGPQMQKCAQCALLLKMGFAIYLRRKFYTLKIACNNMSVYVKCLRVMEVGELAVETI